MGVSLFDGKLLTDALGIVSSVVPFQATWLTVLVGTT